MKPTGNPKNCLDCLVCCKYLRLLVPDEEGGDFHEFFKVWGLPIKEANGRKWALLKIPCQHLTDRGCDIYEDRPQRCRLYHCSADSLFGESLKEFR